MRVSNKGSKVTGLKMKKESLLMLVIENNLISDDIENSYILTNTFNQEGARSIH